MKRLHRLKEKITFTYGIKVGKEKFSFTKKKIGVRQLTACSLQLNFKGEIKCLRIIKHLNLDILNSYDVKTVVKSTIVFKILRITAILGIQSLRLFQLPYEAQASTESCALFFNKSETKSRALNFS